MLLILLLLPPPLLLLLRVPHRRRRLHPLTVLDKAGRWGQVCAVPMEASRSCQMEHDEVGIAFTPHC